MEYTFRPIFRNLLTSKQFQNEKCLKVWIWCLLKSTDKPFTAFIGRQQISLVRGQFIFGRKVAAEELNMSESSVWFWMKFLEKDGSVDIKSNNKFSIVSISKQAKWDKILNNLLDNKKTTKRQQKDTYNKDKKDKKDTKEEGNNYHEKTLLICKELGIKPTDKLNEYIIKYADKSLKPLVDNLIQWCLENNKKITGLRLMNWLRKEFN